MTSRIGQFPKWMILPSRRIRKISLAMAIGKSNTGTTATTASDNYCYWIFICACLFLVGITGWDSYNTVCWIWIIIIPCTIGSSSISSKFTLIFPNPP